MTIESPQLEVNPLDEIAYIRQQIAVMGFNDSEFLRLDQIKEDFVLGKIDGEEAVNKARAIMAGKQDYH